MKFKPITRIKKIRQKKLKLKLINPDENKLQDLVKKIKEIPEVTKVKIDKVKGTLTVWGSFGHNLLIDIFKSEFGYYLEEIKVRKGLKRYLLAGPILLEIGSMAFGRYIGVGGLGLKLVIKAIKSKKIAESGKKETEEEENKNE